MGTLESNLTSTLQDNDLKAFRMILQGLNYYNEYYFTLCLFNSELQFEEYFTLRTDFSDFNNEVMQNGNEVEIYKIASFVKSFKCLLKNLYKLIGNPDSMFKMFVIDCIVSLALVISELVEAKK